MSGVRKTWDKAFYEAKAKERMDKGDAVVTEESASRISKNNRVEFRRADDDADGPVGSERAFLKARDTAIDLDSRVGKIDVIKPNTVEHATGPGFFCEICKSLHKDSVSYLDHVNGKKHQRALGFSMRVERANVDQVKERLELLKRKITNKDEPKVEISAIDEYEKKLALHVAEEERQKRQRKEDAHAKKMEREMAAMENADPEFAALMGFGGFTSKKR